MERPYKLGIFGMTIFPQKDSCRILMEDAAACITLKTFIVRGD